MFAGYDDPIAAPDLDAAAAVVDLADRAVGTAIRQLTSSGGPDVHQVLAYDLAHAASAVATAKALLDYGAKGDVEARITCAFVADVVHDLASKLIGREQLWGVDPASLSGAHDFVDPYRDPDFVGSLADQAGPRHLSDDMEMVQDTFRRSPTTSSPRTPSTSTAPMATSRRRSSAGSARSAPSA